MAVMGLLSLLMLASVPWHGALAFTDEEVREIFKILDSNGDGKVDQIEFDRNKVAAIFRRAPTSSTAMTFEETKVNRAFFDAADTDHDGKLEGVEMLDALPFKRLDYDNKGYITLSDLRRFLTEIGR
jgi:Ca2+-binding EF-hand superfamily protein